MTEPRTTTPLQTDSDRVALVTGGSAGLGLALVTALAADGWTVITDGRDAARLAETAGRLTRVLTAPGDVADPAHRAELVDLVRAVGRLDLLVHNASTLGPLPLHELNDLTVDDLRAVLAVNVEAPHALTRALITDLRERRGALVAITSDAGVAHYPGWGGYGASKAALEHLTLTLAAETGLTAWAVDPGDMRTTMHADAFPGEDISDRPLPESVVPHLLGLLDHRPPSGRVIAVDVPPRVTRPVLVGGDAR